MPFAYLSLLCPQSQPFASVRFITTTGRFDPGDLKEAVEKVLNLEEKHPEKKSYVCTMCGRPATQLVDGEPSCADHIEQVYEHQVEDYTSSHLSDK